jgi:DNA-directed RNA polymerase specialized sigma24 family protein
MGRECTDAELLSAARRDPNAFGELYARHAAAVHDWHARRIPWAAADLTAETFAQAWLARRRFRDRRDGTALPWLLGIARNVLRDSARRDRIATQARERLGLPLDLAGRRATARSRSGSRLALARPRPRRASRARAGRARAARGRRASLRGGGRAPRDPSGSGAATRLACPTAARPDDPEGGAVTDLPMSLHRFGADLEGAIARDLGRHRRRVRIVRPIAVAAAIATAASSAGRTRSGSSAAPSRRGVPFRPPPTGSGSSQR